MSQADPEHAPRTSTTRDWIAIWVSVAALLIAVCSAGIAAYPHWRENSEQTQSTEQYLEALASSESNSALFARGHAEPASPADDLAVTLHNFGLALSNLDGIDDAQAEVTGSYARIEGDRYELCLPVPVDIAFASTCVEVSHFQYSDSNTLSRFQLNNIPIDSLMTSADYTAPLNSVEGSGPIQAFSAGAFHSSDGAQKTVILWLKANRSRDPQAYHFRSAIAQDGNEEAVEIMDSVFPDRVSYWADDAFALVSLPSEARFLYVCWEGNDDGDESCDWLYSIP